MNLQRLVGQHTLHEPDAPVRHTAQRRRIRTVMQELMFKAARLISHARQWVCRGQVISYKKIGREVIQAGEG